MPPHGPIQKAHRFTRRQTALSLDIGSGVRIGGGADSGLCFLHVADADEEHVVGAGNVRGRLRSGAFLPFEPIFAALHWR